VILLDGPPFPSPGVWSKIPEFSGVVRGFRGKLAVLRNLEAKILKTGIFRVPLRDTASQRGDAGLEQFQSSCALSEIAPGGSFLRKEPPGLRGSEA
jgi:hypothetical protein